jgi:hypothetical protein
VDVEPGGVTALLLFVAIFAVVMAQALWWARLDRNPWQGAPLGGFLSASRPGIVPADLTVAEINARGRRTFVIAPLVFAALLFVLFH